MTCPPLSAEKRKEALAAARKARAMAAKLETAAGRVTDAERKYQSRKRGRIIQLPSLSAADHAKRLELEADDGAWLRFFFPDPPRGFWYAFTVQQQAMIDALGNAIRHGGDQSIAASRGEGKTQIARRLTLKYVLAGAISFAVLFAATGNDAADSLDAIKADVETNDLLLRYYPEVCGPVRALESTPQLAHSMLVSGDRIDTGEPYEAASCEFRWCGHEVFFPKTPGSPSAGSIIATRGLDAAVRGLNKRGKRPDVAIIDDPDTEETARSEEQAGKLVDRIDKAIAGLGDQQRSIARVMLTTIQNRTCASYLYTDRQQKPSWKGQRFRYLVKPPDKPEMWAEYVLRVQHDYQRGDVFARTAFSFYQDNRSKMDAGAEVANEHRFRDKPTPDGTPEELSAIQRYYNMVAKIGPTAVACEYDNDPPAEESLRESGITARLVQKKINGLARGVIPLGCQWLTQGIDCKKTMLHWTVRAWASDGTGYTIDWDITETHGTAPGSDEGVDQAIERALRDRLEQMNATPYLMPDGHSLPISCTLVDGLWKPEPIRRACEAAGLGWLPSIGYGRSSGCAAPNFHEPTVSHPTKWVGWRYFMAPLPTGLWCVYMDSDHYKSWEHDRWAHPPEQPGGLYVWGRETSDDFPCGEDRDRSPYAHHICSEVLTEAPNSRGQMVRNWRVKSRNNHWLDASYRATVAAAIVGVPLYGMPPPPPAEEKPSEGGGMTMPDGRAFI